MNDLRAALRRLTASPRFTALAVLILAVGIAGNAVVFSVVNGLFLKPLPFPHPEQLVDIDATAPKWNLRYTGVNYDDFAAWREHNETFIGMATFRSGEFNVAAGRTTARLPGQRVTHDLAEVFGIRPVVGRMFRADEELRGTSKVALIGHHIWTEWFNRDANVVGRPLTIDAQVYEIIGVLPPTAALPSRAAVWIPFEAKPPYYGGFAIGRLKPGVTIDEAGADLLRIHRARTPESTNNADTSPIVQPLLRRHLGGARLIAALLQGAVAALLLIACANVAGLMLARTLARAPELGLRAALGASRWQLVRHVMAEGLVLAACGGAAGVLLGQWLLDALLAPVVAELPSWIRLEMDVRFVVFVCLAVAVSAVIAGLVPARHLLRRLDVQSLLGPGARQMTAPAARNSLMRTLVVGEIALAVLLLLVAGLFGRAMLRLTRIDPGIRAERVLTYGVLLPVAKYRDEASRVAFFEEHLSRLRALADVEAASASTAVPFSGQHVGNFFEPYGGLPGGPDTQPTVVLTRFSLPGYFETMGIEVTAGRGFGDQDRRNVIIVNEALARLFWPGDTAVGKRMRSLGAGSPWLDVIGVARDVRHYGLEDEARPGVYVPFYAMPQPSAAIVVRTRGEPAALVPTLRALLEQHDPTLPLAGLATMEELIGRSLLLRRLYSGMTTGFALIAVVMAMSGLYGVIAYVVGDRTREFGIRLALGAQARDLRRLVVRDGVRLASIGIGIGVIGGLMAGVAMSDLLMGVSPIDPPVLAGTTALLGAVVAAACIVPARRAARLNLLDVLGAE